MGNTTIVTAFFDINRANWKAQFTRSNGTYFKYFKGLASLKNHIVLYTSADIKPQIEELVDCSNITFVVLDFETSFGEVLKKVTKVQQSAEYRARISERALRLPEYSVPAYVTITNQKVWFVQDAIEKGHVKTDKVAWIDFGYVRKEDTLNKLEYYESIWDDDKIHMFSQRSLEKPKLEGALFYNLIYFMGGSIIGSKKIWSQFYEVYYSEFNRLLAENIVDDDQGILLAAYLKKPEIFEAHIINDWFPLFKWKG